MFFELLEGLRCIDYPTSVRNKGQDQEKEISSKSMQKSAAVGDLTVFIAYLVNRRIQPYNYYSYKIMLKDEGDFVWQQI